MAIPLEVYRTFFQLEFTQVALKRYQVLLVVYEPDNEVIIEWIT